MRYLFLFVACATCSTLFAQDDPLSSWNKGASKSAIIKFVKVVTDEGSPNYVPPSQRIAVFDNDGTLWSEQPIYFQLQFAIDRVVELAPQHPEWKTTQPFQAVLEKDMPTLIKSGKKGLLQLVMASHAGMTTDEFSSTVAEWLKTAKHPRFNKAYSDLTYAPMKEVLVYLREHGFKTYIVSGGGIDFMRVFAEKAYGIPTEQVIGSSIVTEFQMRDGQPVIVRKPEIDFIDDKEGKPVAIQHHIGRRPIAAFGNSDGDLQMLQWTNESPKSLCVIVHHTDADREWAYDRDSHIGRLDQALTEAEKNHWTVIDMKRDWTTIYGD